MTTILTVDDSRALRTIINKALCREYDIIEAEDGEKGLEALAENDVDLVLLDVTMPVMDGPAMLTAMRGRGDQTPVVLLTAESKTSLIGAMMAEGLSDYILKPFKPDELREKVSSVLGPVQQHTEAPAYASPASATSTSAPVAGRPFVDVLIVDDMENVAKKFKTMLPKHLKVQSCCDGQAAMHSCRERVFRTIIVDTIIPDVNSSALASQLRVLQPTAAFIGLYMRNVENPVKAAREDGYDGAMVKPFSPAQIDEFLATYYDTQDVLGVEDNVLTPSKFPEGKERRTNFSMRLNTLTIEAIEEVAAACYEDVIVNLSNPPPAETLPKYLVTIVKKCTDMGIVVRVVANRDTAKQMANLADTADIPCYPTIDEAAAAA